MRFLILNDGDSSVGLNGFEVTIEVEDKHEVLEETKEDFIEFMKEKMKEYFEAFDGKTSIMTQEELDSYISQEELLNEGE